jgi:hypothetical protein
MRRVYYAFVLRTLWHPLSVHLAVISIGVFALSRAVSIPDVWANLMQVKVGEMMNFFVGAFLNTQFAVILWVAVIAAALISLTVGMLREQRLKHVLGREAEWA